MCPLSNIAQQRLASLFLALPYAESLQHLELHEFHSAVRRRTEVTDPECRWLAYAAFHSRTETASWTGLHIQEGIFECGATKVFADIQQDPRHALVIGQLTVLIGVVSAHGIRGDQLQIAIIKKSKVRVQAIVYAEALVVIDEQTEFEMCDLRSTDWHCVVVPGYGFGWVHRIDVIKTRKWIPDTPLISSLKELTLKCSLL